MGPVGLSRWHRLSLAFPKECSTFQTSTGASLVVFFSTVSLPPQNFPTFSMQLQLMGAFLESPFLLFVPAFNWADVSSDTLLPVGLLLQDHWRSPMVLLYMRN